MQPIIRHYTTLEYKTHIDSEKGNLVYSDLGMHYFEEEIHEGVHGPLTVSSSKRFYKVPGNFAESTLYYQVSGDERYKYRFIARIDLSMLEATDEGMGIKRELALSYRDRQIAPEEREKYLNEGELLSYISPQLVASFDVDLAKSLKLLDACPKKIDNKSEKEKYLETLIDKLASRNYFPKLLEEPFSDTYYPIISEQEIRLNGSYLYSALERIVEISLS